MKALQQITTPKVDGDVLFCLFVEQLGLIVVVNFACVCVCGFFFNRVHKTTMREQKRWQKDWCSKQTEALVAVIS